MQSDVHLYYGKNEALKGVSLNFEPKGITALIGPSGLTALLACGHVSIQYRMSRLTMRFFLM